MSELSARVAAALSRIQNPRLENDLLSSGMVRDLVVEDNGKVSFTFCWVVRIRRLWSGRHVPQSAPLKE